MSRRVDLVCYDARLLEANVSCIQAVDIVEYAGRTCYKSHGNSTPENKPGFIRGLIKRGHESVLEHVNISMWVKIDRGLLSEWTRHRPGSAYSVSSTRYINYSGFPIEVIRPTIPHMEDSDDESTVNEILTTTFCDACDSYVQLVRHYEIPPQIARSVLPQALAVEMVVTHNIRQWRHVLKERYVNRTAHPDMRKAMGLCCKLLKDNYGVFFEDIPLIDLEVE